MNRLNLDGEKSLLSTSGHKLSASGHKLKLSASGHKLKIIWNMNSSYLLLCGHQVEAELQFYFIFNWRIDILFQINVHSKGYHFHYLYFISIKTT